jgi:hypothetical protein
MLPLFASGQLRPIIDSRYPFDRIADAREPTDVGGFGEHIVVHDVAFFVRKIPVNLQGNRASRRQATMGGSWLIYCKSGSRRVFAQGMSSRKPLVRDIGEGL